MLEALLGLGLVALLLAFVHVASTLALGTLLSSGALLVLAGIALLFPSGVGYHVTMRRGLAELGPPPRGWYWSPTRYHATLSQKAFRAVLPFVVLGVSGVILSLTGCALALVWVLRL